MGAHNLQIHKFLNIFGQNGMNLRLNLVMKIHLKRCCGFGDLLIRNILILILINKLLRQQKLKKKETELSEIQEMEQRALHRQKTEEKMKIIAVTSNGNQLQQKDPNEIDMQQQAIPAAVYAQNQKKKVGALDRFNA